MNEVVIHGVAAGGNGVGRLADGMVVFVPRTAPGDVVQIDIVEKRKNFATGRLRSLVQSGDDRVDPQCPHYVDDECGGCQLQHLSLDAQRRIKGQVVGDAIRRIARRDCVDPLVREADLAWRYRSKVTLHRDANDRIGLHPHSAPTEVFQLRDCQIVNQRLMDLWHDLGSHRHQLPTDLDQVILSLGRDGLRHAVIVSRESWSGDDLASSIGADDVCLWLKAPKQRPVPIGGANPGVSPSSFEQANDKMADAIRRHVVDAAAGGDGAVAWDLYGGFGDTARLLAARGFRVWSVDRDPDAHDWAANEGHQDGITWVTAPAEQAAKELPSPDFVVVNPPRSGMPGQLCEVLNGWGAEHSDARLAYISCDPATLARDLSRLPSFCIEDIAAFDLFPHTSHVETSVLLRAGAGS